MNRYTTELAIFDHLNECLIINQEIKREKNRHYREDGEVAALKRLKYHYNCELTDLYILLDKYVDKELVKQRLEKFKEKEEQNDR